MTRSIHSLLSALPLVVLTCVVPMTSAGAGEAAPIVLAQGKGSGSGSGGGAGSGSGSGSAAGHTMSAEPKGDKSASSKAYAEANMKMHTGMDITFTGDSDVDFVKGMIPHHSGAVDMARIVLTHGKDPEIRKLAEEIIKAQETEIAFMNLWLAKQDKK